MSRLTELLAQAKTKDAQMGADLEREFKVLSSREAHPQTYRRIEAVAESGGRLRALDLTRADVRGAVRTAANAGVLYGSALARDYV